jgi:hypothetical protein
MGSSNKKTGGKDMEVKKTRQSWKDFRCETKKYKQKYSDPSQLDGEPWRSIKNKKQWRK